MTTNKEKSKEFIKRFDTCAAKWNLIFAYKSALESPKWEDDGFTTFAAIRNYAQFCNLDVQKMILSYYSDENHDWVALQKQMDSLTSFLDMVLEKLVNRS